MHQDLLLFWLGSPLLLDFAHTRVSCEAQATIPSVLIQYSAPCIIAEADGYSDGDGLQAPISQIEKKEEIGIEEMRDWACI